VERAALRQAQLEHEVLRLPLLEPRLAAWMAERPGVREPSRPIRADVPVLCYDAVEGALGDPFAEGGQAGGEVSERNIVETRDCLITNLALEAT
jgi:hypothetical protein